MKRFILILTAFYFLLASMFLPQGDFSALSSLTSMYHHCKTTEDPDMTMMEFISGHLLNMDHFFHLDNNKDEHELPHSGTPFQSIISHVFYCMTEPLAFTFEKIEKPINADQKDYCSPYFSRLASGNIFQPPKA